MSTKRLTDLAIQIMPDELFAQVILGKVDQEVREILIASIRRSMTEKERQRLDNIKKTKKNKLQKKSEIVQS